MSDNDTPRRLLRALLRRGAQALLSVVVSCLGVPAACSHSQPSEAARQCAPPPTSQVLLARPGGLPAIEIQPETSDPIGRGLVWALARSYWAQDTEASWRAFLGGVFVDGRFNLEARNRRVKDIARSTAAIAQAARLRVLIMEHVGQRGSRGATYQRMEVSAMEPVQDSPGAPPAEFGVRIIAWKDWQAVEPLVKTLVEARGSNNGIVAMFDDTDATVVSYFDGRRWHVETWFCFSCVLDRPISPGRYPELRDTAPHVQAFARLLWHLNKGLTPPCTFGESRFADLIDEAGRAGRAEQKGGAERGTFLFMTLPTRPRTTPCWEA
jgi:hypothetical protein